jgi:hypothetical protein
MTENISVAVLFTQIGLTVTQNYDFQYISGYITYSDFPTYITDSEKGPLPN